MGKKKAARKAPMKDCPTGAAADLVPLLATIGAAKGIGALQAGGFFGKGGKGRAALPFVAGGAVALGSQYAASQIAPDTELKAFSKSLLEGTSSAALVSMVFGRLAGVATGTIHGLLALEKHLTGYRESDIQEKLKGTQDSVSGSVSQFGLISGETAQTLSLLNAKLERESRQASTKDRGFDSLMRGFTNLWSGDFRNVGQGASQQLAQERMELFRRELAPTLESLKTAITDYAKEGGKRDRLEATPIGIELEKAFKRLTPGENLSFKSLLDTVYQGVQAEQKKTTYAEQAALAEKEKLATAERARENQEYIAQSMQKMAGIFDSRARSAQMAMQFPQGI